MEDSVSNYRLVIDLIVYIYMESEQWFANRLFEKAMGRDETTCSVPHVFVLLISEMRPTASIL